jgi:hypothetical protein
MICGVCKVDKDESEFYNKTKKRKQYCCKPCFNLYCSQRWIQKKIDAIKKLGGQCVDCKKEYHYSVYDFHHLRDKDYSWAKLRLQSPATINKELSKCVLLCSNCHRIRHYSNE